MVEYWVWCEICRKMIYLRVDKKEIIDGLQDGVYIKKFIHRDPLPDRDDPNDRSGEDHNTYLYIYKNYDILRVSSSFGGFDEKYLNSEEMAEFVKYLLRKNPFFYTKDDIRMDEKDYKN